MHLPFLLFVLAFVFFVVSEAHVCSPEDLIFCPDNHYCTEGKRECRPFDKTLIVSRKGCDDKNCYSGKFGLKRALADVSEGTTVLVEPGFYCHSVVSTPYVKVIATDSSTETTLGLCGHTCPEGDRECQDVRNVVSVKASAVEFEGFVFDGHSYTQDGSRSYYANHAVSNLDWELKEDQVLPVPTQNPIVLLKSTRNVFKNFASSAIHVENGHIEVLKSQFYGMEESNKARHEHEGSGTDVTNSYSSFSENIVAGVATGFSSSGEPSFNWGFTSKRQETSPIRVEKNVFTGVKSAAVSLKGLGNTPVYFEGNHLSGTREAVGLDLEHLTENFVLRNNQFFDFGASVSLFGTKWPFSDSDFHTDVGVAFLFHNCKYSASEDRMISAEETSFEVNDVQVMGLNSLLYSGKDEGCGGGPMVIKGTAHVSFIVESTDSDVDASGLVVKLLRDVVEGILKVISWLK